MPTVKPGEVAMPTLALDPGQSVEPAAHPASLVSADPTELAKDPPPDSLAAAKGSPFQRSHGSVARQASQPTSERCEEPGSDALLVAAFYQFTHLPDLEALRRQLLALATAEELRGTILLAAEGVNGTLCGPDAGVRALLERLRQEPGLETLQAKFSRAPRQAFQRLKVRIKREIVSMGCPSVKPAERVGRYVEPRQWDALIRDPDTLVIDTRNSYEVAIGSFERAIDPGTSSFRQFPAWVEQQLRPLVAARQPKAIALFCTGGIRCEKATSYLLERGFPQVHHLQGGILRYLEEMPEEGSSWRGECFVFDRRVALTHRLEPGQHQICHACGLPLAPSDLEHPAYREGVSCHHCIGRFSDADRARFAERQRQMGLPGGPAARLSSAAAPGAAGWEQPWPADPEPSLGD